MITERVLSESGVSVSLSNGGLSRDGALRKDGGFATCLFKESGAKTTYTTFEKNITSTPSVFHSTK